MEAMLAADMEVPLVLILATGAPLEGWALEAMEALGLVLAQALALMATTMATTLAWAAPLALAVALALDMVAALLAQALVAMEAPALELVMAQAPVWGLEPGERTCMEDPLAQVCTNFEIANQSKHPYFTP